MVQYTRVFLEGYDRSMQQEMMRFAGICDSTLEKGPYRAYNKILVSYMRLKYS